MSYLSNVFQHGSLLQSTEPSLYEHLTPSGFIDLQKSHFVEWFSGNALDTIWTFTNLDGTNTGAMDDAVDGGYKITTGTTSANRASISFNGIEHYSNTGSVLIGVVKTAESTSHDLFVGLGTGTDTYSGDQIVFADETNQAQPTLRTIDAGVNRVATTLSFDTVWKKIKLEARASSGLLWADGVLEAISTTDLPQNALNPHFVSRTRTTAARTAHIRYLEVFNI